MSLTGILAERENALTPIYNKEEDTYHFYSLEERLNAPILNWSDKFSKLLNESYIIGNYGQKNIFSYHYNEDGAHHNNGEIHINNAQLKEKNEIKSRFYSVEQTQTYFESIDRNLPIFKLWDKKIEDKNGKIEIKYRELSNHFHWLETEEIRQQVVLKSKNYNETEISDRLKIAQFESFDWSRLLDENYLQIGKILDRISLIEIEMNLTPMDIYTFNFFCRIYIEQLGAIFLPNKISYQAGKLSKVELIKISD